MPTIATEPEPNDHEIASLLSEAVARSLQAPTVKGQDLMAQNVKAKTRAHLMDLLEAPRGPIHRSSYAWSEVGPGLKLHIVSEDAARGVKRCLVWGIPGSKTPRHGHRGDEVILVLEGHLRDDRGSYGPGDICRSSAGEVHQEQVVGDVDCVCFVVYYGEWIPV